MTPDQRYGPLRLPVAAAEAATYLKSLGLTPRSPMKDLIVDAMEPDFSFDIAAIEAHVRDGTVPIKLFDLRVEEWNPYGVRVVNGTVGQDPGGNTDLMYAASMLPARACEPVIVIDHGPEGYQLIDGSHRIARALIEGRVVQKAVILKRGDVVHMRRSEHVVERFMRRCSARIEVRKVDGAVHK
ncbi:hypothetical protein KZX46_10670 [Polymorphobacter sp. PAMC 29334]|uniref:hypothetical protein n=1 Tax=Polymorphobacter sp. PAMC 29334 TaxID=2862331 RepID=UPI001C7799FC|nr:hypothetical protein [Polymorphobacter sp. PAMC 29334]QYE36343.1 hypothetical protein KZX46_10670 [Polymorphobacter sp. PAMC 29334]